MAEWWQSPAYDARAAAGQVQTPGLVDWGGLGQRLYDDFQAPYWQRQDREQGAAVADPMQLRYTAEPRFVAQMTPRAPTLPPTQAQMQAMRDIPGSIPADTYTPSIKTAQAPPQRLPTEMGYGAPPATNPAVAAIQQITGTVPRGMLVNNRSRDSLAYAQAGRNALANMPPITAGANGGGVLDLTFVNPRNPQAVADSEGKPIRVGTQVYYPGGKAPPAAQQGRNAPQQQRGLGAMLGAMFGGGGLGQQAPRNTAGAPIVAASGPVINGATYGVTADGSVGDYGSSPGQITSGLQPGERRYDAASNSWGLR